MRLAFAAALALLIAIVHPAHGDTIRVATFNAELSRDGPGLLLRDILKGNDPQIAAVVQIITENRPDILALQGIDWDYNKTTLSALNTLLHDKGHGFDHMLSLRPNAGLASNLDLDGDGRLGTPADAQGFGEFSGQGGIALLSRLPILHDKVLDFSPLLWRDVPDALLPTHPDGTPFPSAEALAIQRLSQTGHWVVPITLPDGSRIDMLTFQAAPPVFDGPEDRNGRRNHDEVMFWHHLLDGRFGPAPDGPFIIAGGANQDPNDGDSRSEAIRTLLNDSRLQDPEPTSAGAAAAPDQNHTTDNALDTVDWPGPGRLRVDYVIPSTHWRVVDAGVIWPAPDDPDLATVLQASRHRLVWVDLRLR